MPKVEVKGVSGGVLKTDISGDAFQIDSGASVRVDIPIDLSDCKLRVEQVGARKLSTAKAGDALVRFDAVVGENAREKLDAAHQRAVEALAAWDQAYLAAWRTRNEEIESTAQKMREPDADLSALSAKLDSLREDQRTLEGSRMLDGVARTEKEPALAAAREKLDAIDALADNQWVVKADGDYLVGDVHVAVGDEYAGLVPLIALIPADAPLRVGIVSDTTVKVLSPNNVLVYGGDQEPLGYETGWVYDGESVQGNQRVFWAVPTLPG